MTIDRAMDRVLQMLEEAREALNSAQTDMERLARANRELAVALDVATLGGLMMPWVEDNRKRERVVAERCIKTFREAMTELIAQGGAVHVQHVHDIAADRIRARVGCSPADLEVEA
ncbi:MAG TPA: hypothetical protein VKX25_19625 [Bryobacteraceae bacterium]|jgi:hypothetical protein|nr:hypothetical protein [Bryobacteraceae bacterium]